MNGLKNKVAVFRSDSSHLKLKKMQCGEPMREQWKPTVGLEIHAQIATKSKLFSNASTDFLSPLNSNVSFFDCATPGTLPVLNRKCVESAVLTALALSCQLNEISLFERKHYFYADLPAGFQITQQRRPIAIDGKIKFHVFGPEVPCPYFKSSKIKQIQLEQDSGKSLHHENMEKSLIDLNRAGVPLMEFVFEPDLSNGEEAAALVKELDLTLQLLGVCSGKMEEGAFRVDANVSVSDRDGELGVRTEIKNIGSVRAVAAAVTYEINRHISILEAGGEIFNETCAWDAIKKKTIPMREKEEKEDYRFMPETNLPPLRIHVREDLPNRDNLVDAVLLRRQLPELPKQIRQRLKDVLKISPALIIALMSNLELLQLFHRIIEENEKREPQLVANFLVNYLLTFIYKHKLTIESCTPHSEFIGEVIDLLQDKLINLLIATKILKELISGPKKLPKEIVQENNWFLISDTKLLEQMCLEVVERNPKIVKVYKKGKTKVAKALIGEIARNTRQCADMAAVAQIIERLLTSN
ncbi:glutamyl-tRNA(Gln) amidotransferase subunit B, mitochondrial isoform X2 [Odontomachus brunneus]|uniref:glutamyl-tRNA(Gln) amidotransferase subunit B, mitochondrial isoform X2 n=1 Tax=Odontomachus brunneus TaxID=486640 RepID=UPI0013F29428|nr:glutamyl-tRNA(Gln) amidotransferase subunit B, mitochondrial isoform X2 [Odontomachus brunneus]